jgi:hypothetical protein
MTGLCAVEIEGMQWMHLPNRFKGIRATEMHEMHEWQETFDGWEGVGEEGLYVCMYRGKMQVLRRSFPCYKRGLRIWGCEYQRLARDTTVPCLPSLAYLRS